MNHIIKKLLLPSAIVGIISISSCTKENSLELSKLKGVENLTVPDGFTWNSSRDVNFSIGISDNRFGESLHVVSIYNADPKEGGTLLSKGSASVTGSFNTKLYLPTALKEVFVVKTAPDGSKVSEKVSIDNSSISITAGSADISKSMTVSGSKILSLSSQTSAGISASESECSNDYTRPIKKSTNEIDVSTGQIVAVTGDKITVGLRNATGGILRICGTDVTIKGTLAGSVKVVITSGGSATFPDLNINGSGVSFINYGTAAITKPSFNILGTFTNNGEMSITNSCTINSAATFLNNKDLKVTGDFILDGNTKSYNSGHLIVDGSFHINNDGAFENDCSMYVKNDLTFDGIFKNDEFVNAGYIVDANGNKTEGSGITGINGTLFMDDAAIFQTKYLNTLDGTIKGTGVNTSLFKVLISSDSKVNNSSAHIAGTIQYCDGSRTVNSTVFTSPAQQSCANLFIASSSCSPGNGTPSRVDSDGDGICDEDDDYPADKTKAFNNYQFNYNAGGSIVAFEDNWPMRGDYDLNDVVLNYRYQVVTSALNNVVQINADYKLIATGGVYQNGAGIQFNIPSANASRISGARLEAGQDSLVVILFNNSREQQTNWNTDAATKAAQKDYSISIDITDGPKLSALGVGNYNVFIWNNSAGRGYETHLPGKAVTKLMNTSLFGTDDDNSVAGLKFTTNSKTGNPGLPWALEIPVPNFTYPLERTQITDAYSKFTEWATSGGKTALDWYDAAYRNSSKVFIP